MRTTTVHLFENKTNISPRARAEPEIAVRNTYSTKNITMQDRFRVFINFY
jgi:hypothetical protein